MNVRLTSQLARAHALHGDCQQVNYNESRGQRYLILWNKVFEVADSSNLQDPQHRVVTGSSLHEVRTSTSATRESTAPFLVRPKRLARILAIELLNEFNDCQRLCQGCLDLMFQSRTCTPQPIYDVRTNSTIRLMSIRHSRLTQVHSNG